MKNIEKVAVILIVLWFLSLIPNPLTDILIAKIYGLQEFALYTSTLKAITVIRVLIGLLVQIGVAGWLFTLSKKGEETPWVWCLFGLAFGISAVILFFIFRLYKVLKEKIPLE